MSVTPLVGAGLELASEVFKFFGEKEKKKYAVKIIKLKNKLNAELNLPVDEQDDSKIETITEEIKVIQDLAIAQLRAYANKKS